MPTPPRTSLGRRALLLGALGAGGALAAGWFNVGGRIEGDALSVLEAHDAAANGAITLIDIRRPEEWARTGIGQGALPLDMRDPAFADNLLAALDGAQDAPVALICARGVRSRRLARRLEDAGFTNVLDVPEGMLGSGAGPGWLGADLPLRAP